jgi:hypothetical protein
LFSNSNTRYFCGFCRFGVSEDFLVDGFSSQWSRSFFRFFREIERTDASKASKSSRESLRVLARHHNGDASAGARNVFHIARLSVTCGKFLVTILDFDVTVHGVWHNRGRVQSRSGQVLDLFYSVSGWARAALKAFGATDLPAFLDVAKGETGAFFSLFHVRQHCHGPNKVSDCLELGSFGCCRWEAFVESFVLDSVQDLAHFFFGDQSHGWHTIVVDGHVDRFKEGVERSGVGGKDGCHDVE